MVCNGRRRDSPAVQNTNNVTPCLIYTFEFEVNLLELNPAYPKDPKTLGERIRKARMDRSMMIKELAALIGVSPDTIINWELRGVKPTLKRHRKGLVEFLGPEVYDGQIPMARPLQLGKSDVESSTTQGGS